MTRLVLAFLALLFAANAAAQVYRWTDEKGRVIYGNQPPPSASAKVVQERIQSYSGAPEVQRAPASRAAPVAPRTAEPLVMYATSWCGYCAKARAYFARNRIQYVEHDVERDRTAHAEFKRLGGRGVPLIVQGGNVMRGFSEQSFEAFIARAGG